MPSEQPVLGQAWLWGSKGDWEPLMLLTFSQTLYSMNSCIFLTDTN